MSIRNRLLVILGLIALSVFYLVPRNITVRERDLNTGVITDRTEKRVPLKLGLDLQGGMHLALELDQSKQVSADPKRDLDLALTVLRKRIDEFGVSEPVIQKVGDERLVVELPGIDDPARAKAIVQRSAFLEFRITDETNALEKALPAMDRALRGLGIRAKAQPGDPRRWSSCSAATRRRRARRVTPVPRAPRRASQPPPRRRPPRRRTPPPRIRPPPTPPPRPAAFSPG